MKTSIFSLAAILLGPVIVLAQDATSSASTSASTCGADYIVEACLTSTTANQQDCGQQDYTCQCAAYQAIQTCFNNCPGDPRQAQYVGLVSQYCALATQYASTNSVRATATSAAVSGASTATAATTTAKASASATGTSTASATDAAATENSGANLAKGAGGLLGVVAGAVVALL